MRYAVVSDVHGNLQAWEAVLADIRGMEVGAIICLGDIVGYGPDPAPVLASVYARVQHVVIGNHDAALCGRLDAASFNEAARAMLAWTRTRLDSKADAFFRDLPLVIEGDGFRCAHGELDTPGRFRYIAEPADAERAWLAAPEPLVLVGHTHIPGIFVRGKSGRAHHLEPRDFSIEAGKRYIVNPGSVGLPRDGDIRASYCVLDTDRGELFFRRVPFDIDAYIRRLGETDAPVSPAWFVSLAQEHELPCIRESLDFEPPASSSEPTVSVRLADLERRARRWRRLGVALLLTLALLAGGLLLHRADPGPTGAGLTEMPATGNWPGGSAADGRPALELPPLEAIGAVGPDNALSYWSVFLADPGRQTVEVVASPSDAEDALVLLANAGQAVTMLRTVPLACPADERLSAQLQFRTESPVGGYLAIVLVESLSGGGERILSQRSRSDLPSGRWTPLSTTMERPLGHPGRLCVIVKGEFSGTVKVRKLVLVAR